MAFDQHLDEKTNGALLREALAYVRCNAGKLALLFLLPAFVVNLVGLVATFGAENFMPAKPGAPFALYVKQATLKTVDGKAVKPDVTPHEWQVLAGLPKDKALALELELPAAKKGDKPVAVKLTVDPAGRDAAWVMGKDTFAVAPADFLSRRAKPQETWQSLAAQVASLAVNLLLLLFLFSHVLIFYFNEPPVYLREVRTLARYNLAGFGGTALLLAVAYMLVSVVSSLMPLFLLVAVWLALRFAFAPAACLTEGLSPVAAINRSFQLTRGQSLRLLWPVVGAFAYMLLAAALAAALAAEHLGRNTADVLLYMLRAEEGRVHLWPEALVLFNGYIMLFVFAALPLMAYYLYALYMDVRTRAEGLAGKVKEGFFEEQRPPIE